MNIRLPGTSRTRTLLATAIASLAVLLGSAYGRVGREGDFLSGFDAVFAAAEATFPRDAVRDDLDLHDGRSAVPLRWQAQFERFARSDRTRLPPEGGVVFVGSSSIDYWSDLQAQFPTHPVIQRGLPGATMADCTRHVDRLVLPYRPRVVVVYAGDNDLAAGASPEEIVAAYAALVREVRRVQPAALFVFVSIKPSPSRTALMPLMRRTNALMAAYARTDRGLDYVDVFTAMLDAAERPRRELFNADGLHMTPTGYALWREAIVAHLD